MKKIILDFIKKESRWSSIRAISNKKMVKNSYLWLVLVPVIARALSQLDEETQIHLFGGEFYIKTSLPFAWQMLFIAAIFFAIASLIYRLYCPDIIKLYKNYREFEASGKTVDQTRSYLYDMTWDDEKEDFKHINIIATYFNIDLSHESDTKAQIEQCFSRHHLEKPEPDYKNKLFYIVRDFAQTSNQSAIKIAISFYAIGFAFVFAIMLQNIVFVVLYSWM